MRSDNDCTNSFESIYPKVLIESIAISFSIKKLLDQLYQEDEAGVKQLVNLDLISTIESEVSLLNFNVDTLFTQGMDSYFYCLPKELEKLLIICSRNIGILKTLPQIAVLKNSESEKEVCFAESTYLSMFYAINEIIRNLENLNKKIII